MASRIESTATQDNGLQLVAASITLLILSTIAVALRVWGRLIATASGLWWDDWLALAALPFVWSLCALGLYLDALGYGKYLQEIQGSATQVFLVSFIFVFVYNTGLTLVKCSVLVFYRRVFGTTRANVIVFGIVGALLVGWFIAINFLNLFACTPVRKAWIHDLPGSCTYSRMFLYGTAIPNIFTDLLLLILPMPLLWRLQMGLSRKLALAGAFAAGYCVLIISIIRLAVIVHLEDRFDADGIYTIDTGVTFVILGSSEVSIALISSCLPGINSLVKHAAGQRLSVLVGKSYKKLTRSDMSSGGGRLRTDAIGLPTESHANDGCPQLHRGAKKPYDSDERLWDGILGTNHDTRAWPAMQSDGGPGDIGIGISLHQIRVREDVDVNALGGV